MVYLQLKTRKIRKKTQTKKHTKQKTKQKIPNQTKKQKPKWTNFSCLWGFNLILISISALFEITRGLWGRGCTSAACRGQLGEDGGELCL